MKRAKPAPARKSVSARKLSAASKPVAARKPGRPAKHYTSDGRPAANAAVSNGVSPDTFRSRLARGWDADQAATVPVRRASRDKVK